MSNILKNIERDFALYQLHVNEKAEDTHTADLEKELLANVIKGDVEMAEEKLKFFPAYGSMDGYFQKKYEEYITVTVISLVARAAIDGGVSSEESFALSGLYFRYLAIAESLEQMWEIRNDAILRFTKLVHNRKVEKKIGVYVTECKKYIESHLLEKISASKIAENMGINPIYLERFFKSETGVTIGEYIRLRKMERACQMLTYSDKSLLEISECLGFPSQSYFGQMFKREMGVTPKQYRMDKRPVKY